MFARVAPTPAAPAPSGASSSKISPASTSETRNTVATRHCHHPERFYELRPPDPLPTLDLSLSLESCFLSRPALNRMKRFVRRHRVIRVAAWLALAAYFATMLVPVAIGRATELACIVLWIPATVASTALLRYEVALLLVRSYDFWFCSCINTSTFFVLSMIMGADL